jgi:hypothetical protein
MPVLSAPLILGVMDARTVDDAATRLHELRAEELQDLALGGLSIGFSLVATGIAPQLALPFFLGGLLVGLLGMRALVRRYELLERLAADRDAHAIAEVRRRALREATLERRRTMACHLRLWLTEPLDARLRGAARELALLVADLEDDALELEPACAVACARLLSDPEASPLLNVTLPADAIQSRARRIREGFTPQSARAEERPAPGAPIRSRVAS